MDGLEVLKEIRTSDELHTLPGRFAEEPVTQPLVAVEAYIGRNEFFLAYEGPDGLVYSGGNWSNRIDLNALRHGAEGDYTGPFILSLEYHRSARWDALPEDPIEPRLLSSKYWNRFIDRVFETVLPKIEMAGIVIHFQPGYAPTSSSNLPLRRGIAAMTAVTSTLAATVTGSTSASK